MKVTVCEMNDDREKFATDWQRLVNHVLSRSSDLVLLPEMPFAQWLYVDKKFDRKTWERAVVDHVRGVEQMDELGAPTAFASRPVTIAKRRLNQGFVWTKKGGARGVHYKSYLPNERGYYEALWYDRGDREFRPFLTGGAKAGLMICTDMWALVHARSYGKQGVHLIAVPRATGKASVEKWVAGGKAAAIISGAFTFSSNRSGSRGDVEFGGCGWAIDPDGRVLGLTSKAKPFVTVDVDLKDAEAAKETYPRDSLQPD